MTFDLSTKHWGAFSAEHLDFCFLPFLRSFYHQEECFFAILSPIDNITEGVNTIGQALLLAVRKNFQGARSRRRLLDSFASNQMSPGFSLETYYGSFELSNYKGIVLLYSDTPLYRFFCRLKKGRQLPIYECQ